MKTSVKKATGSKAKRAKEEVPVNLSKTSQAAGVSLNNSDSTMSSSFDNSKTLPRSKASSRDEEFQVINQPR